MNSHTHTHAHKRADMHAGMLTRRLVRQSKTCSEFEKQGCDSIITLIDIMFLVVLFCCCLRTQIFK